jgi:carbamoyltransferase
MLILGCLGEPAAQNDHPWNMGREWSEGWYHNSAAVLLENDRVVFAVEEERLTRRKHTGSFPFLAIESCLSHAGVAVDDLDFIAFGEAGGTGEYRDPRISPERIASVLRARFAGDADLTPKIRLVEHHLGHAMSALAPSGFERALIFTCDGFGDGLSAMVALGKNGRLTETLYTYRFADSLGRFYSSVLGFLGYGSGDEYKVMGLAPYGDPAVYRAFFQELYDLLPDGRFSIRVHDQAEVSRRLEQISPRRAPHGPFEPAHQHVAAAIQEAFERIVFHVLSYWRQRTNETCLCLAGGTAQNSTCNGKVLSSGMFEQVYVQPAAHDAGLALGAALHIRALAADLRDWRPHCPVYAGPGIPEPSPLERAIRRWEEFVDIEKCPDICGTAAELLAAGQIIGWVQGRSEFGPRALGNRSILADPRPRGNRERVNTAIKMREAYRPFAPAVREDFASTYFELPEKQSSLPWMTFAVRVRERYRSLLGAVTHVDGTARIQSVSQTDNPRFWDLLTAFEHRTGLPILLNTSFNNDAEPIVQDVDDAIGCFLTTGLDVLAIGDYRLAKRRIAPEALLRLAVHFRSDVLLTLYFTSNSPRTVIHALVARNWRVHPISPEMFRLLADVESGDATLPPSANRDTALGAELFHLWSRRVISLRPASAPVIE